VPRPQRHQPAVQLRHRRNAVGRPALLHPRLGHPEHPVVAPGYLLPGAADERAGGQEHAAFYVEFSVHREQLLQGLPVLVVAVLVIVVVVETVLLVVVDVLVVVVVVLAVVLEVLAVVVIETVVEVVDVIVVCVAVVVVTVVTVMEVVVVVVVGCCRCRVES